MRNTLMPPKNHESRWPHGYLACQNRCTIEASSTTALNRCKCKIIVIDWMQQSKSGHSSAVETNVD